MVQRILTLAPSSFKTHKIHKIHKIHPTYHGPCEGEPDHGWGGLDEELQAPPTKRLNPSQKTRKKTRNFQYKQQFRYPRLDQA
jgi:hypothetical protein